MKKRKLSLLIYFSTLLLIGVFATTLPTTGDLPALSESDVWGLTGIHIPFNTTWNVIKEQHLANGTHNWSYATITESQISDLVHTTDTNETTRVDSLFTFNGVILGKNAVQNVGGANGATAIVTWDTNVSINTDYFMMNATGVKVLEDGYYIIKSSVSTVQGGAGRTTLEAYHSVNGVAKTRGIGNSYSRGSAYGDLVPQFYTESFLSANDFVSVIVKVDDSDAVYTINTIADESEFIVRKIAS